MTQVVVLLFLACCVVVDASLGEFLTSLIGNTGDHIDYSSVCENMGQTSWGSGYAKMDGWGKEGNGSLSMHVSCCLQTEMVNGRCSGPSGQKITWVCKGWPKFTKCTSPFADGCTCGKDHPTCKSNAYCYDGSGKQSTTVCPGSCTVSGTPDAETAEDEDEDEDEGEDECPLAYPSCHKDEICYKSNAPWADAEPKSLLPAPFRPAPCTKSCSKWDGMPPKAPPPPGPPPSIAALAKPKVQTVGGAQAIPVPPAPLPATEQPWTTRPFITFGPTATVTTTPPCITPAPTTITTTPAPTDAPCTTVAPVAAQVARKYNSKELVQAATKKEPSVSAWAFPSFGMVAMFFFVTFVAVRRTRATRQIQDTEPESAVDALLVDEEAIE